MQLYADMDTSLRWYDDIPYRIEGDNMAVTIGVVGQHMTQHSTLYAAAGFGLGILLGSLFSFMNLLEAGLDLIVGAYGTVAPLVIFCILAPSLLRIQQQGGGHGRQFSIFAVLWFAKLRFFACLLAVALVSVVYNLPLLSGSGFEDSAFTTPFLSVANTLVRSPYFFAIYASIIAVVLLWNRKGRFVQTFAKLPEVVEKLGEVCTFVVPVFTFLVGIYVVTLPQVLEAHFAEYSTSAFGQVRLFGIHFDTTTAGGILRVYIILALLTGLICSIWHAALLLYARYKVPGISLRAYFTRYYLRIYPLLWSTSSEAESNVQQMFVSDTLWRRLQLKNGMIEDAHTDATSKSES